MFHNYSHRVSKAEGNEQSSLDNLLCDKTFKYHCYHNFPQTFKIYTLNCGGPKDDRKVKLTEYRQTMFNCRALNGPL